jgi:universal stress protein A
VGQFREAAMFRKILLPLDLADKHDDALQQAADLARPSGGEITLLHVVERIPGLEAKEDQEFYGRLEKAARDFLRRLSGRLPADVPPAQTAVRFGNRAAEVVRFAREAESDLIVLTCPPFNPENPGLSWGSLSWKISLLAACPVLLVK